MDNGQKCFEVRALLTDTVSQKDVRSLSVAINELAGSLGGGSCPIVIHVNRVGKCDSTNGDAHYVLLTEPTVVLPENSRTWPNHVSVGAFPEASAARLIFPWVNSPNERVDTELLSWNERSSKVVIIAANKFSFIKGELYGLRRSMILSNENIALFGAGWNQGPYRAAKTVASELLRALRWKMPFGSSHIGSYFALSHNEGVNPVSSKFETMSGFKFALVIENSLELRTEKLYDAIEAGCFPVYVGPEVQDGIPAELFHHSEPSVYAITQALDNLETLVNFEYWRKVRKSWLSSESYCASSDDRLKNLLDLLQAQQ